MSFD
jgi:hypothetical protein